MTDSPLEAPTSATTQLSVVDHWSLPPSVIPPGAMHFDTHGHLICWSPTEHAENVGSGGSGRFFCVNMHLVYATPPDTFSRDLPKSSKSTTVPNLDLRRSRVPIVMGLGFIQSSSHDSQSIAAPRLSVKHDKARMITRIATTMSIYIDAFCWSDIPDYSRSVNSIYL